MDYKKILNHLKTEIEELEIKEEVKSSLVKIESVLSHLYRDIIEQEEEKVRQRVVNYVKDRSESIKNGEMPINMKANSRLVVQVVPVESFKFESHSPVYDVNPLKAENKPLYSFSGWNHRNTRDGILAFSDLESYSEIKSNGVMELVDSYMLDGEGNIPSGIFEKEIFESVKRCVSLLQKLDIEGKIFLRIELQGVKNFNLATSNNLFSRNQVKLDEENLHLPDILLDNASDDIDAKIKPSFDYLWRRFGYKESINFENGKFKNSY
jgi:hypothetical protein